LSGTDKGNVEKEKNEENGRYVYCMIKAPLQRKSFGNIGFGGEEVYTLEYRDFAPVVSNAPVKNYEVNDEEVELHRKVVEHVMKEHDVIPVAYGMAFKNKKLLLFAMSAGYKAMRKAMTEITNKVELGVKVLLPKEDASWDGKEQCRSDFMEALKKNNTQSKELKLFSDRLIMNSAFLVDRDKIEDFSDEIAKLETKYANLKVQYSGPWPPYNFVDIQILSKRKGGFR
jgi:hypothetical protein